MVDTHYCRPNSLRSLEISFSAVCISAMTLANSGKLLSTALVKDCWALRREGGTSIPYHFIGSEICGFRFAGSRFVSDAGSVSGDLEDA